MNITSYDTIGRQQTEPNGAAQKEAGKQRLTSGPNEPVVITSHTRNVYSDIEVPKLKIDAESESESGEEQAKLKSHYTISEDTIGAGTRARLSAIDSNGASHQRSMRRRRRRPVTIAGSMPQSPLLLPEASSDPTAKSTPDTYAQQARLQLHDFNIQYRKSLNAKSHLSLANPPRVNRVVDVADVAPYPSFSLSETIGDTQENTGVQASGPGVCPSEEDALLSETSLLQSMMQRIMKLEAENQDLRKDSQSPLSIPFQTFHCLESSDPDSDGTIYLSEPDWEIHGQQINLRGRLPVLDPDGYEQNQRLSFAIYKGYPLEHHRAVADAAMKANKPLPAPEPTIQTVKLVSKEMVDAMKAFFDQNPSLQSECPKLVEGVALEAPYNWWYHRRKSHRIHSLPQRQADLVMAVVDWIESNYSSFYNTISDQFDRGMVARTSMEYLIQPGDVLVSYSDGAPRGYVALARPRPTNEYESFHNNDPQLGQTKIGCSWRIPSWSFAYAGDFFPTKTRISLTFQIYSEDDEIEIANLTVIPLAYASDEVKELLFQRGHKFWKLRTKQLISYRGDSKASSQIRERFMVDFSTYKELHPYNHYSQKSRDSLEVTTNLPVDSGELEEPDVYVFPTMVPGFDLRRKKWVDLNVDQISDVDWNEKAFQSLVADEDMKELILALVTNQLDDEKGTDVINHKGNGLIMLLHGSPGTGKTFTAESVAEIARKPLYPVTCGDIGTEPEAVEKYLQSVFHLGKIWDCVVLLDEAEVFLEQRTLQDLKRNALVSVFLRALEYYDGILILTTNRVGTFDEAFRSRIQLALRYEKLKDYQRRQIWRNFLSRLKELGEEDNIDFDDIVLNLDELVKYPMNGRQIRNSITTARQLAKYMKRKMTYSHLKRAITVADKFDKYLADVQEGDVEECGGRGEDGRYSPEYFARVDQVR
ncbi:hypothetical protein NM208_g2244 [Fusarium decemcellulare]|uniref:Uncharacterized protein n=1 Tax=Fusarium decemcellulare TaxID=57161 RepID=A0ACC1STB6_9HYPO|nr:hypothetical protein NM208_g2244 [Fusarium decemcellulare]